MRREQVLKLCLNHALTSDIHYTSKDSKSWYFVANDYSENELERDNFCLRFKTEEIAQEFKQAIDRALSLCVNTAEQNGKSHTDHSADDSTSKLTADLQLPENFFDYKNCKECAGCRGCNDDYVFPEIKSTNLGQADDKLIPLVAPTITEPSPLKESNVSTVKPFSFGFSGIGNSLNSNTKSSTASNTQSSGMFFSNSTFNSSPSLKQPTTSFTLGQSDGNVFGSTVTPTNDQMKKTPTFSFSNALKPNSKYYQDVSHQSQISHLTQLLIFPL